MFHHSGDAQIKFLNAQDVHTSKHPIVQFFKKLEEKVLAVVLVSIVEV